MTLSEPIHGIAELETWPHPGTNLAVLGFPVRHSISPAMHNAALRCLAKKLPEFGDWRYFRFEVEPAQLGLALRAFHRRRFRGLNLTLPHKVAALAQAARVEPKAELMGAVNTLRWTEAGWEGFNTDGYGLRLAVQQSLAATLAESPVLLLGAGGAARAAAVECVSLGCPELFLLNRTPAKQQALLDLLRQMGGRTRLTAVAPEARSAQFPAGLIVVNATSLGLKPDDPAPFDVRSLPDSARIYDMIYNPPETALLREARARGLRAAGGLSMLVHQGARSLEIWGGTAVPVDSMSSAAQDALQV